MGASDEEVPARSVTPYRNGYREWKAIGDQYRLLTEPIFTPLSWCGRFRWWRTRLWDRLRHGRDDG